MISGFFPLSPHASTFAPPVPRLLVSFRITNPKSRKIAPELLKLSATESELSGIILEQTGGNDIFAIFEPTVILKAKDFATEITIFNSRQHRLSSESAISGEHVTNNEAVRQTLIDRDIRPESLPTDEDVKKFEALCRFRPPRKQA